MSRFQNKIVTQQEISVEEVDKEILHLEKRKAAMAQKERCRWLDTKEGCINPKCQWDHPGVPPSKRLGLNVRCKWETINEDGICPNVAGCTFKHKNPRKKFFPKKKEAPKVKKNKTAFPDFIGSLIELEDQIKQLELDDKKLLNIREKLLYTLRDVLDGETDEDCVVDHELLEPKTNCPECDLFVCRGNSTLTIKDAMDLLGGSPKKESVIVQKENTATPSTYSRYSKFDWSSTADEEFD